MSFKNAKFWPGVTDPAQYHGEKIKRGDALYPMSPSSIKDFSRCPARWLAGYKSPDSKSKDFGSLIDTVALTPELFESRYVILPEQWEVKGGKNTNAYRAWKAEQGTKTVIDAGDLCEAKGTVQTMRKDPTIAAFLDASDKQVMVTAEYCDKATGLVIPVRCLIDLAPRKETEFYKCLGDLKTTRSAALVPFVKFAFQMGYQVQAAFDLDLYVAATGEDRINWCFILQENFPPFQTGKRMLGEKFIDIGRMQYQNALARYAQCLKSGKWPGYDDHKDTAQGWSIMEPLPYMANESAEEYAPDEPEDEPPGMETDKGQGLH